MADSEAETRSKILEEANQLLNSSAKWLIAALGAIGAVLIAGSQLSSLGSLPLGRRFALALVGLAVGLAGVAWAIWRVLDVLAPPRYTISELSAEWTASGVKKGQRLEGWRKRRRYAVVEWFAMNPEHLANHESPVQLFDHWKDRSAPDRDLVLVSINNMLMLANHVRHQFTFSRMRVPLAASMALAAAGICVFAWAANPPEKSPSTLRNVDLSGADLSGAALAGADLTGADLTSADLRGAVLVDAVLKDVVWSNTTCPDGTNSDDTAAADGKNGSCEGHLTP